MTKLYAIGDSYTYGFNFREEQERVESVWPTHLAEHLSIPHSNLAIPGGSNWRMARLVTTLPFTKNDIVVIGLSDSKRFEFGVSPDHKPPLPNVPGDINEVDGELIAKRFFSALSDRTVDRDAKTIVDLTFSKFRNDKWFERMHIIMCSAMAFRLQQIGCRWLMFDAWMPNSRIDIPNYILPNATMHQLLFGNRNAAFVPPRYWNKKEHKIVADIILQNLQGTFIGPTNYETYNPSTDLDQFY